jgi:hypothetical protein
MYSGVVFEVVISVIVALLLPSSLYIERGEEGYYKGGG